MKRQGQFSVRNAEPMTEPSRPVNLYRCGQRVLSCLLAFCIGMATLSYPQPVAAAPFVCDPTLYVSKAVLATDPTQLTFVDFSGTTTALSDIGQPTNTYNGIAYRIQDNFLYSIRPTAEGVPDPSIIPPYTIYRVERLANGSGTTTDINLQPLGVPVTQDGTPINQIFDVSRYRFFAGGFSDDGTYYAYSAQNGALIQVDVTTSPPRLLRELSVQGRPQVFDIAFNPIDNRFYSYDVQTRRLIAIDPTDGSVQASTNQGPQTGDIGADFFDVSGRVFLYDNTRTLFRVTFSRTGGGLTIDEFVPLADNLPGVNLNDGASCPLARLALEPGSDLALTKGVNNANPNPNDPLVFTITVTNSGPVTARDIQVSENLPAGFTATAPAGTTFNPTTQIWTIDALAVGESAVLRIEGTYNGTPITNRAQIIQSSQPDPDSTPGNNVPAEDDTATVTVPSAAADLSLEKEVDNATPLVGDRIQFTVTLTNSGPDTATNIAVTDTLPSGLNIVRITPSTGTFSNGVWQVPSLASGSSTTLVIVGTVTSTEAITNVAEVTAVDQSDPDSTPNNGDPNEDDRATAAANVNAELNLIKRITAVTQNGTTTRFTDVVNNPPNPNFVGVVTPPTALSLTSRDQVEYTLYFQANNGTAQNVTVCDAVPAQTAYVPNSLVVNPPRTTAINPVSDAADSDAGQFLSPLTAAPEPCLNGMNPNGSVFFNVGNVQAGNFGFVRFTTQIQ